MSDLLVLLVIVVLPVALVVGPLALLTLGIATVADLDGNGLVRSAAPGSASVSRRTGRWRGPFQRADR